MFSIIASLFISKNIIARYNHKVNAILFWSDFTWSLLKTRPDKAVGQDILYKIASILIILHPPHNPH